MALPNIDLVCGPNQNNLQHLTNIYRIITLHTTTNPISITPLSTRTSHTISSPVHAKECNKLIRTSKVPETEAINWHKPESPIMQNNTYHHQWCFPGCRWLENLTSRHCCYLIEPAGDTEFLVRDWLGTDYLHLVRSFMPVRKKKMEIMKMIGR